MTSVSSLDLKIYLGFWTTSQHRWNKNFAKKCSLSSATKNLSLMTASWFTRFYKARKLCTTRLISCLNSQKSTEFPKLSAKLSEESTTEKIWTKPWMTTQTQEVCSWTSMRWLKRWSTALCSLRQDATLSARASTTAKLPTSSKHVLPTPTSQFQPWSQLQSKWTYSSCQLKSLCLMDWSVRLNHCWVWSSRC